MLVPIVVFYTYSNYVSQQVIKEEIHSRNINRLTLSLNQLESNIDQLSQFLVAISMDSDIHKLRNIDLYNNYEAVELKRKIIDKLLLHKHLSKLTNEIMIVSPTQDTVLGTSANERVTIGDTLFLNWSFRQEDEAAYFIRHFRLPMYNSSQKKSNHYRNEVSGRKY